MYVRRVPGYGGREGGKETVGGRCRGKGRKGVGGRQVVLLLPVQRFLYGRCGKCPMFVSTVLRHYHLSVGACVLRSLYAITFTLCVL